MWTLTNRLARPSLTRRATLCALSLNGQALQCLQSGGAGRLASLDGLLEAGETCWRLFRPALAKPRWREVKAVLDVQARMRSRAARPQPRRKLRRALEQQSAWLGELTAAPPPEDALLDGLTRLYRKAGRSFRRDPGGRRARRHGCRWLLAEELLLAPPGHTSSDPAERAVARFEALTGEGFAMSATAYRRALRWRAFLALATEPEPFGVGGGTAGADSGPG